MQERSPDLVGLDSVDSHCAEASSNSNAKSVFTVELFAMLARYGVQLRRQWAY